MADDILCMGRISRGEYKIIVNPNYQTKPGDSENYKVGEK